ncbi:carboxypeptidase-like regulatory domain-containing protein [Hymenobacter sp. IS2118]|uniref:carboxypeptidase-like regulatory domain-containing protein n=1 Tax=Hymenobacter sp. IS2118 TaxID=1505605 RepID=UPI0005536F76|nr:carboxypeptidase-like regulatory domain-containing protein [Hymenobacter sp. IS2118]
MKRLTLLVFLIVLLKAMAAMAQPISGTITNADSHAPLPFVNIGVVGRDLGTVSSEQGTYQLLFREALADDTVRVSSVGYQTRRLTLRALLAQPNLALAPVSVGLQEVQVQGKSLFRRNVTLGTTGNSESVILKLQTEDLGAEMGTVISLKHKPTRLRTANFNVASNTIGPLTLRVNLYRLDAKGLPTETKLLSHDLIITSEIMKGTLSVDLTKEQLVVDEDFFLAVEWIKSSHEPAVALAAGPTQITTRVYRTPAEATAKPGSLVFSLSLGYMKNDMYVRKTSQATWERVSIGVMLLGMQPGISFFVTAQD